MIFVDSTIPLYLVGEPHPHKTDAQVLLERAITGGERLVTDAEVLQEIFYRYVAIDRVDAIQPAFDALLGVVDQVFPVDLAAVERAKTLLFGSRNLSAREALHIAVMEGQEVSRIMSFDAGFDGHPGLERLRV